MTKFKASVDNSINLIRRGYISPIDGETTYTENRKTVSLISESEVEAEFKRVNSLINRGVGTEFAQHLLYLLCIETNLRQVSTL